MSEGMNVEWEWIPNKSLGDVCIGDNIEQHKQKLKLKKVIYDERIRKNQKEYEETYELPNLETSIYVEHKIVTGVTSWEEFKYNGVNLIGQKFSDLENILNCTPDDENQLDIWDDGVRTEFNYDGLGLQIWILKGVVELASM
jgi:hypothetical protein